MSPTHANQLSASSDKSIKDSNQWKLAQIHIGCVRVSWKSQDSSERTWGVQIATRRLQNLGLWRGNHQQIGRQWLNLEPHKYRSDVCLRFHVHPLTIGPEVFINLLSATESWEDALNTALISQYGAIPQGLFFLWNIGLGNGEGGGFVRVGLGGAGGSLDQDVKWKNKLIIIKSN